MRSGSTLLKSLLATAPDISHLPETDFQDYSGLRRLMLKTLSDKRIILVKKPAPYDDANYPILNSFEKVRKIILIRDVYDTVLSLQSMNQAIDTDKYSHMDLHYLAETYWCNTYEQILRNTPSDSHRLLIRYEDLVTMPEESTKKLFNFVGSSQRKGVSSYASPTDYQWSWGNDDGGELIKSLKVTASAKPRTHVKLNDIINNSTRIQQLRTRLGYT